DASARRGGFGQGVRQWQHGDGRTVERVEPQLAAGDGADLRDEKKFAAAARCGIGVDDGAAGLIAECRCVEPRDRLRNDIAVPERKPLLEAPQITGARDDLLAGIATLAEADAAQRV